MRKILRLLVLFSGIIMAACGGGDRLNLKGEEEAVLLAQNMVREMGGRKNWESVKSLYIRTVAMDMTTGIPFNFEEWINLDEPKFMNHRIINDVHHFQIVDGNDGWMVQNERVSMMQPDRVTGFLKWYDQFFMRNVRLLALGGDQLEVKINKGQAFDLFVNGTFLCGFGLDADYLPARYVTQDDDKRFRIINITKWGEYKGFRYPLEVTGENIRAHYNTDYWDAGSTDAESFFKISFDPYKISEIYK